jgi:hypothetical protein
MGKLDKIDLGNAWRMEAVEPWVLVGNNLGNLGNHAGNGSHSKEYQAGDDHTCASATDPYLFAGLAEHLHLLMM